MTSTATTQERSPLLAATLERAGRRDDLAVRTPLIAERRTAADRLLRTKGFPSAKDEAFRFTPIRDLVGHAFGPAMPLVDGLGPELLPARVVIGNGSVAHVGPLPEGIRAGRLSDASSADLLRVAPLLGSVARDVDGFSAQNTALFEDAVLLFVDRGAPGRAVHLSFMNAARDGATAAYPRVLVVAADGADVTILETHAYHAASPLFENATVELALGDGTRVEHVRVLRGNANARSLCRVAVRQGRDSFFGSRVFTLGGALSRLDIDVVLGAPGAECALDGLYVAGDGEHVDHQTRVDHESAHATSKELYKGIVAGNGRAVFDGTVFVRRGAERTRAHQQNRNLLLGEDAVVHAKPHLEIDADDVQCSHGTTVGRLDETQLFYLRSRGIGVDAARAVLTYSFAREVVDAIQSAPAREIVAREVLAALPGGELSREVTQ